MGQSSAVAALVTEFAGIFSGREINFLRLLCWILLFWGLSLLGPVYGLSSAINLLAQHFFCRLAHTALINCRPASLLPLLKLLLVRFVDAAHAFLGIFALVVRLFGSHWPQIHRILIWMPQCLNAIFV